MCRGMSERAQETCVSNWTTRPRLSRPKCGSCRCGRCRTWDPWPCPKKTWSCWDTLCGATCTWTTRLCQRARGLRAPRPGSGTPADAPLRTSPPSTGTCISNLLSTLSRSECTTTGFRTHFKLTCLRVFLYWTLGRSSMYESGISISARMVVLMAMAALWIWLAQSRLCLRCFLSFSESPFGGTHGTGSHHFSSFLSTILRNDPEGPDELIELDDILPCSAYQNSVSSKLSNISWQKKLYILTWFS